MTLFDERMLDRSAVLEVSSWHSNDTIFVKTEHEIKPVNNVNADNGTHALANYPGGKEIAKFYSSYVHLKFCQIFLDGEEDQALVYFVPVQDIPSYTQALLPTGKYSFAIDTTKSATLYRDESNGKWIVFARTGSGWLSIFLTGERAGHVFYITPEPHFNNLRPIAKSFNALLQRMATDPAKFLRLTGSWIPVSYSQLNAEKLPGCTNWAIVEPVAYHPNASEVINSKCDR